VCVTPPPSLPLTSTARASCSPTSFLE
jgi:hypothetical protein